MKNKIKFLKLSQLQIEVIERMRSGYKAQFVYDFNSWITFRGSRYSPEEIKYHESITIVSLFDMGLFNDSVLTELGKTIKFKRKLCNEYESLKEKLSHSNDTITRLTDTLNKNAIEITDLLKANRELLEALKGVLDYRSLSSKCPKSP